MAGLASINGKVTSLEEAAVPALDRGLLFGDSVFEVLVGFMDKLVGVQAHLERLRRSAAEIGIPIPWTDAQLSFELDTLASSLRVPKASYRLIVTRGSGMGLKSGGMEPNKYIYALPAPIEPIELYSQGVSLQLKSSAVTDRGGHPKTSNYLKSILALREAQSMGFYDILWANADREVTESSTANIFFIARDGHRVEVVTPSVFSGLLEGITRARLLQLLTSTGFAVQEQVVYADELPRFDEAFLCSTVRGLVPVSAIDKHRLHGARANSIFRMIETAYLITMREQIGVKIDWRTGNVLPDKKSR